MPSLCHKDGLLQKIDGHVLGLFAKDSTLFWERYILYVWPRVTTGSEGTKKDAQTNAPIAKSRQNEGVLYFQLWLCGQYWLRYSHRKMRGLVCDS